MNALRTLAIAALLAASVPAFAQQAAPAPKVAPAKDPEPDPAILRAMKSKLFVIHHLDPAQLAQGLMPLRSGTSGSAISWTNRDNFNTLSARDFPENLAVIEEAIKRLDVPSQSRKAADVELTLHVLFASKGPVAEASLPADLQEVVKQLKNTLAYRGYALAASLVQRVGVNGDRTIYGRGQLEVDTLAPEKAKDSQLLFVDWESDKVLSLEPESAGPGRYSLRKFYFLLRERRGAESLELARMGSDINLKEGEKVVVGTTVVKDRGLIVVLSARRVN
ncbi:MAG: hypothetical protein NDI58_02800 [Geothrix sp.]|nr:hypothetical protein [Geothrix sp.]